MKLGYAHALGMILCLFVFLASIYTSQEPFRYLSSNLALRRALHLPELEEKTLNRKEIWHWMTTTISEIGGHTVDKIEANCAYDKFKTQKVTIDGHDYNLLDPSQKMSSCSEENMEHIDGAEEVTYMAGSHQLLSFGVFTKRSVPHEPVKGSVKVGSHLHEIPSDDVHGIDPAHDHKVADVCHVAVTSPTDDFNNDTLCVLIDGFKDKIGTSVNWPGRVLRAGGQSYYAFEEGSSATLFLDHHYQAVYPCYSYDNHTDSDGSLVYDLKPGIPYYEGDVEDMARDLYHCAHAWITAGEDIRSTCLKELAEEPTPRQAYVAAQGGFADRVAFFDYHFGCGHALNATHEELEHIFIEAEEPLEAHLDFDNANGMFFHCPNQRAWIESSLIGQELLELNEFIDLHTRVFEIFLVSRDLAEESLFYTLLRVKFSLTADGAVDVEYHSIFSPIIHYMYAMDDYEWHFKEVLVFEVMFSVLFAFFVYRELSQLLFNRIIPGVQVLRNYKSDPPVFPEDDGKGESDHSECPDDQQLASSGVPPDKCLDIESNSKMKGACSSVSYDELQQMEEEEATEVTDMMVLTDYTSRQSPPVPSSPRAKYLPRRSEGTTQQLPQQLPLKKKKRRFSWDAPADDDGEETTEAIEKKKASYAARKARSERHIIDRLRSIGGGGKGIDLNGNGVDDIDEMKELIEDYLLPDEKGRHDILDWITIITISVAISYRVQYVMIAKEIHDLFMHLDEGGSYNRFMENIVDDFEELFVVVANVRIVAFFVVIFGLLQFFRYLSFDRRFGIVTDTITSSFVDLIPVLIIFAVVCMSYAVIGTGIYGQDLVSFQHLGSSLSSLFLMILGQFDGYYDMVEVSESITVMYFWSFVIIAYFILFNMVLAVIFTVYDEEYDGLKKEEKEEATERLKMEESAKNK